MDNIRFPIFHANEPAGKKLPSEQSDLLAKLYESLASGNLPSVSPQVGGSLHNRYLELMEHVQSYTAAWRDMEQSFTKEWDRFKGQANLQNPTESDLKEAERILKQHNLQLASLQRGYLPDIEESANQILNDLSRESRLFGQFGLDPKDIDAFASYLHDKIALTLPQVPGADISPLKGKSAVKAQAVEMNAPSGEKAQNAPITLVNSNAPAIPDSDIFVLIKGLDPTSNPPGKDCFITFDPEGRPIYNDVTSPDMDSRIYSTKLSDLPQSTTGNGYLAMLPPLSSGRIYLSVYQPLALSISPGNTIQDPSMTDPQDPNYYIAYDKMEFSNVDNYGLFLNGTSVDGYCLPLSFSMKAPDEDKTGGIPFSKQEIMDAFEKDLPSTGMTPQLFSGWDLGGGTVQNFRVIAPSKAYDVASSQGFSGNVAMTVDANGNYSQVSYSDWLEAFSTFYSGEKDAQSSHSFFVDAHELPADKVPAWQIATYRCYVGEDGSGNPAIVAIPQLPQGGDDPDPSHRMFQPLPKFDPLHPLTSDQDPFGDLFGGAGGVMTPPNNTPQAIIVRDMTAAFDTNTWPKDDTPLSQQFFSSHHKTFYQYDPDLPQNMQVIDLYSKILHGLAESQPGNDTYTFAYDDILGQDATAHTMDPAGSSTTITLGDLSNTTVPNFADDSSRYFVTVTIPGPPQTIWINGQQYSPGVHTLQSVAMPIKVLFTGPDNKPYTTNIFLKYPTGTVTPPRPGSHGIVVFKPDLNKTPPDLQNVQITFPGV